MKTYQLLFTILFLSLVVLFGGCEKSDDGANITANFESGSTKAGGDNTAELQALIDQCPTNGTVSIPAGTYMIDAVTSLKLKSDMTLQMESGTILKAIPNGSDTYAILKIVSVTNVNVIGGTLQGERHEHLTAGDSVSFPGNQWGMGIHIAGSSNVLIDGVTATQCWGDGFYIAGAILGANAQSKNITIQNVVADDNRRQGLSIENVDGLLVQNSTFKNTNGQSPFSGIDIEPYADYQNVTNVIIKNNQIYGNQGCGIEASFYVGSATQRIITIEANDIHDNRSILSGLYLSGLKPGVTVKNNNIHNNQVASGISLNNSSTQAMITGNTVVNNLHNSVIINTGSTQNTITGNTFTGNGTDAILDNVGGNVISPNIVSTINQPASNSYIVAPNSSVSIPVNRANTANSANFSISTMPWTTGLLWTDVANPLTTSGTIASITGGDTSSTDGSITVTTGSATGNAVVYVKNSSGNICWSWHIWVTDYAPSTTNISYNTITWMDRNLGATNNTHNVVGSMGLYYQWGRKDPFPGPTAVNTITEKTLYGEVASIAITPVAASPNLVNAIQNPATFYTNANSASARDWYTNVTAVNNALWAPTKTLYDPCPVGWKVPANGAWADLTGTWTAGEYGYMFTGAGWYHATRKRNNDTGLFGTAQQNNNGFGYYWTSTVKPSTYEEFILYFYNGTIYPSTGKLAIGLLRANGASVRCVKE